MNDDKRKKILIAVQVLFSVILVVAAVGITKECIEAYKSNKTYEEIGNLISITPSRPAVSLPAQTQTNTPQITVTPTPDVSEPTVTPEPTQTPEVTPEPTQTPDITPEPTQAPEITPEPTVEPTQTPEVTPEPTVEPTLSVKDVYGDVYEKNNDMIGWIKIDGTRIDYPVMQTKDDEHYYLYKDINHKKSDYGVPYALANCTVGESDNMILMGHHMKNGTMFSDLIYYRRKGKSYWEQHRYVYFDTFDGGFATYEIFAFFKAKVPSADPLHYTERDSFANEEDFNSYIASCKKRSQIDTGITPTYGEDILTLITCNFQDGNTYSRFVVMARRIA